MQPAGGPLRHRASARHAGARVRARHASVHGEGFGRFAAVTVLSVLPGAGLLAAGRRRVGGLLLALVALVLLAVGVLAASGSVTTRALRLAVDPRTLLVVAAVIVLVAVLWCLSVVATAWTARPARSSGAQRVLGVALVGALCVAIAAPSSVGVRYALIQHDLITSLFSDGSNGPPRAGSATPNGQDDPWAGTPRVNMLLLGSDAGDDRTGVRTDSMMVASIDTSSGDTVLFGLPRSLQKVPFPTSDPLHKVWPNGFDCGDPCLLNAVWEQAATTHRDLFAGDPNPGLTATRDVIGEVLGLRIDNYAIIDLRGFQSLVDAMGGVDVDVPRRIPIGGGTVLGTTRKYPITGYIPAGQQHLNGYQALWFSRSREGSDDYDRMRRQRCMTSSLLSQANPAQLLSRYPKLASVAKKNVQTDVRQQDLAAWVTLVQRIQGGSIRSLPFTNDVISTVNPDFARIRSLVRKAIAPRPERPAQAAGPSIPITPPSGTTSPSPTPSPSGGGKAAAQAQDFTAVC